VKGGNGLPNRKQSESEIRDWCIAYVGRLIGDGSIPVGPDIPFPRMGLDSASSAYFVVELEDWLGVEFEPEIVAEHPTIAALARHLAGLLTDRDGTTG
jgi:acyl carrier protein